MAIHEEGVAEGDQRQDTDAECAEAIVPTYGPERRTEPGRDAEEGASADEAIGSSKETESTHLARAPVEVEQAVQGELARETERRERGEPRAALLLLLDHRLPGLSRMTLLPSYGASSRRSGAPNSNGMVRHGMSGRFRRSSRSGT